MPLRTSPADRAGGPSPDRHGTTQKIACWVSEFGWRVSIAATPFEEPFSVFVGVDRSSMVLDGDRVHSIARGTAIGPLLTTQARKSADDSRSCGAWFSGSRTTSEMSGRSGWCKDVQVIDRACVVPAAEHGVLFALRGGWELNDLIVCSEGQGVRWADEPGEWKVVPVGKHALMMVVGFARFGISALPASAP